MKSSVNFAQLPSTTLLFFTKFFILSAYSFGKVTHVFLSIFDTISESAKTSTELYELRVLASVGLFKLNEAVIIKARPIPFVDIASTKGPQRICLRNDGLVHLIM